MVDAMGAGVRAVARYGPTPGESGRHARDDRSGYEAPERLVCGLRHAGLGSRASDGPSQGERSVPTIAIVEKSPR
jgi:hypothetical protein